MLDYEYSQLPEDELEEHMLASKAQDIAERKAEAKRWAELHSDSFMGDIGGGWNQDQFRNNPMWVMP